MKLLILLALAASAQQPSVQEQAAALTAPAKQGAYRNNQELKALEEIEREEDLAAGAGPSAQPEQASPQAAVKEIGKPAPSAKPSLEKPAAPVEPRKTHVVSHAVTTRFLFLKISDAVLRFHVDPNLGDKQLETVVEALRQSCIKAPGDDMSCNVSKQSSVVVDRAFFSDVDLSKVDRWSQAKTPTGLWKLVCASGGEDCFDSSTRLHQFKLTANRSALDQRILAHGFETQMGKAAIKKRRLPASASPKTVDRVYVTRTTSQSIPHLPKGTL